MKKYYINPHITYCYPYDVTQYIDKSEVFGVLEQYMYKVYTRDEIDKIICELIIKHPYIDHSMHIGINIMWMDERNVRGYYHILNFKNDKYDKQKRKINPIIKYEK